MVSLGNSDVEPPGEAGICASLFLISLTMNVCQIFYVRDCTNLGGGKC
jgi:hypothetical protein